MSKPTTGEPKAAHSERRGDADVTPREQAFGYPVGVRTLLACLLCAIVACAETRPAQVAPDRPPASTGPDTSTTVSPSAVPPPLGSAESTHEVPDTGASIGDVTCSSDDDCVVTTKFDCCACCSGLPLATSRAWLKWRDETECPKTKCTPCGKRSCQTPHDPSRFLAVCDLSKRIGRCGLVPK